MNVTLPEPTGGVWASGPQHGVSHVVDAGTYECADPCDVIDAALTGPDWTALRIPGSADVVVVATDALA